MNIYIIIFLAIMDFFLGDNDVIFLRTMFINTLLFQAFKSSDNLLLSSQLTDVISKFFKVSLVLILLGCPFHSLRSLPIFFYFLSSTGIHIFKNYISFFKCFVKRDSSLSIVFLQIDSTLCTILRILGGKTIIITWCRLTSPQEHVDYSIWEL